MISQNIVRSKLFTIISTLLIFLNCWIMTQAQKWLEEIFKNILYDFLVIEIIIHIFSEGLILHPNAYFRTVWNLFDAFLISFSIIFHRIFNHPELDLSPFLCLRLLKILEIKSLKIMLHGFLSSLKLLTETFFIILQVILLFSIIGIHLFSGLLKHKCFFQEHGIKSVDEILCGNFNCPKSMICGKLLYGKEDTSFDNIIFSLITMFRIFTLDNWSNIVYSIQRVLTNYAFMYFFFDCIFWKFYLY